MKIIYHILIVIIINLGVLFPLDYAYPIENGTIILNINGFEIKNIEVQLSAIVNREDRTGYNVLGFLPASNQTEDIEKSYVMLGAHYAHLGHGTGGNSLARNGEEQQVHNGADDNSSYSRIIRVSS